MKDFIFAALPFVIVGICLALLAANHNRIKDSKEKNHMAEGMCIGMCFGVALATSMHFNLGFGISLGMLVGETVGMFMPKK